MTIIADKFLKMLLDKTQEEHKGVIAKHLRNVVPLRENYDCNIYYLTSNVKDKPFQGFWNFSEKQISVLKTGRGFIVVFLTAPDRGYLVYCNELDKLTADLSVSNEYYKIKEVHLCSKNFNQFRTIDEFLDLILMYKKQNTVEA